MVRDGTELRAVFQSGRDLRRHPDISQAEMSIERGLLLYQQSRYEMAEAELRQALGVEPNDAYAHALLALCLIERKQADDATAEAQQAIHLAPDMPFAHYA